MAARKPLPKAAAVSLDNLSDALAANMELALTNPDALPTLHAREGNPVTLGPRVPEAADWAKNMVTAATNAGEKWLANTLKPKKEPLAEAKKAATKYKNNMQVALNEGRFEKGIAATDEAQMYETIRQTGSAGFSSGVQRRTGKITAKIALLRPLVGALCATLDAMPQDTDAQREAKMLAAKRGMQDIGKKLRG
jgi:hypothetical protein